MYHFVYKTYSKSGRYYLGRHSTKKIDDGYLGSGKWVKSCIRTGTILSRDILVFCETYEELRKQEEILITEHIDNKMCMNFHSSSSGFGCGKYNVSHTEKEKQRKSDYSWSKTKEGREWFSTNNPSRKESVKKLRKDKAKEQLDNGTHNFLNPITRELVKEVARNRWTETNPMHQQSTKQKVIDSLRSHVLQGTHNSQIRCSCMNCKKETSLSNITKHVRKCVESLSHCVQNH